MERGWSMSIFYDSGHSFTQEAVCVSVCLNKPYKPLQVDKS